LRSRLTSKMGENFLGVFFWRWGVGEGELGTPYAKFAFDANRRKYMNQRNQVLMIYKQACKLKTVSIIWSAYLSNDIYLYRFHCLT